MHRYLGFIASAFAVLGVLSMAAVIYAHSNDGGMAIIAFQLWAVIAGGAATVLGFLARLLAKSKDVRPSRASNFGMGVGLGVILALLLSYFLLG